MAKILTGGIPVLTSIALLVIGFLEVTGVTHLIQGTQFGDINLGYAFLGSGSALIFSTWILSVLSDVFNVSMAKVIFAITVLAGIAYCMYIVYLTMMQASSVSKQVGWGFLEFFLGVTGLTVIRKTLL